ncbi:MAG: DUF3179 domain-containing (seleno)protein, partial [Alphaproteobacteria bacterium]
MEPITTNDVGPHMGSYVNFVIYAAGLSALLAAYVPFSPFTADLVSVSREARIAIYRARGVLWTVGAAALGLLLVRGLLGDAPIHDAGLGGAMVRIGRGIFGTADPNWLWAAGASAAALIAAYWASYIPFAMTPASGGTLMTAAEAEGVLGPDDLVLGLVSGSEARAYPRDVIARQAAIADTVGGRKYTVTYCVLSNSAVAFLPDIPTRAMRLVPVTTVDNNVLLHDPDTGNFVQQLDGRIVAGPGGGRRLKTYPVTLASWRDWKGLYPESKVHWAPAATVRDKLVLRLLRTAFSLDRLAQRTRPWHRTGTPVDRKLPAMTFVLGVEINGEKVAYPTEPLKQARVVNDKVGGAQVAVFCDGGPCQVFSRR